MAGGGQESIRRSAAFALAVQLTTAVFTAALTLFLVRALDPEGYGDFALAFAIGAALLVPTDFGVSQAAARFIAERRGNFDAIASLLHDALRLRVAVSGVVAAALALAAGPIADAYDQPGLTWPLRGMALALFAQSVMQLLGLSFVAQGRVASSFRIVLGESTVETGASAALVLLGGGAAGAAFGRAIGYGFGAGLALALTLRLLGRRVLAGRTGKRHVRRIAGYAGALAIVDGAYTLFEQIDAILIGAFLNAAAVGQFQAPMRLVAFLHYPGLAAANAVTPRLARAEGELPRLAAFASTLRLLVLLQAAMVPPVLVWAGPISDLVLGTNYEESANVLRALAPYVFLAGLAPLVSLAANYLGEARRRVPVALAALVVNLAIDVALIPEIGIVAGAIGTNVAFALYVAGHLRICARLIAFDARALLLTCARAAVAAGAMSLVLLAFGTDDLSPTAWVVGLVAGPLAFLAVVLALGERPLRETRALRD